jgi:hypothetical protein
MDALAVRVAVVPPMVPCGPVEGVNWAAAVNCRQTNTAQRADMSAKP